MVVFRCGIIDKTEMYEAARQKCSRDWFLWVLNAGRRSARVIGVLFEVVGCVSIGMQ